jgi:hypothetical protein
VYEESTRTPFIMRYPPLTNAAPDVIYRLVANIDIAPTVYHLAGIAKPANVQGRSLVDLLQNPNRSDWRQDLFIEGWPSQDASGAIMPPAPYTAVHTDRFVYVETQGDRSELYDLWVDPYQLNNKIRADGYGVDTFYESIRQQLYKRLHPCHVLTAAFGRPDHPVIQTLWQAHQRLVGGQWDAPWHQAYLRWYDRVGPRLAGWVAQRPWVQGVLRGAATLAARLGAVGGYRGLGS